MSNFPHFKIVREAWPFLAIEFIIAVAVTVWSAAWSIPAWLVFIFTLRFFRDPVREIPQQAGAVLSPCDGRVIKVERTQDPYGQRDAILFSVIMNVFKLHLNRSPVDGTIQKVQYFPGKFVSTNLDKASPDNERNAIVLNTVDGHIVTFVQVAGLIARRILCSVKEGDALSRGQRYGFIRFGSRVDVYLPLNATVKVSIGDKVSATTTILAQL